MTRRGPRIPLANGRAVTDPDGVGSEIRSERGGSLVEWSLIVALIALVAMGGVRVLGSEVSSVYEEAGTAMAGEAPVATTTTAPVPSTPEPDQSPAPSPSPGHCDHHRMRPPASSACVG